MDASEPFTVDTVLAPVDGSDESATAVEYAIAVADRYDAAVHALFVLGRGVVRGLTSERSTKPISRRIRRGSSTTSATSPRTLVFRSPRPSTTAFHRRERRATPAMSSSTPPTTSTPTSSCSRANR